mgnify:CR=1 FL=1
MRGASPILALLALALALAPFPAAPALGAAAAAALFLAVEPRGIRRALPAPTLLLLVTATVATGAAVTWAAGTSRGAAAAGAAFLRLLALVFATATLARRVDADAIQRAAAKLRLPRLGLALGLALNALPHLAQAVRDTWISLAVRTRRRHPRLRDLGKLAEVLLAHAGRVAEEAAVAAALRGHRALVQPLWQAATVPPVVAVVGRSGTGKTPLLSRCVARISGRGWPVYGFLQPALTEGGEKTGFAVRDVGTGREAVLARRVGPERGQHGTPYVFFPEGFALARAALAAGPRGGILVVDELGPVELRGGGHWPAVRRALARRAPAVVLVGVRRQLLSVLLTHLRAELVTVVDVEHTPDAEEAVVRAVSAAFSP